MRQIKNYFKVDLMLCLMGLLGLIYVVVIILFFVFFLKGRVNATFFIFQVIVFFFCMYNLALYFTYPKVYDDSLEMSRVAIPSLSKRYDYADIERIEFLQMGNRGKAFVMQILLKNGDKASFANPYGIKMADLPSFTELLQSYGVNVENKINT